MDGRILIDIELTSVHIEADMRAGGWLRSVGRDRIGWAAQQVGSRDIIGPRRRTVLGRLLRR
jgi:hypothetical protein